MGLVEAVAEGSSEQFVFFAGEGRGDHCGIGGIGRGIADADRLRHDLARVGCGDLKVRDEENKAEIRRDRKTDGVEMGAGNGESPEHRGSGIVGMALQFRTETIDPVA